jgi:hypothetical protein
MQSTPHAGPDQARSSNRHTKVVLIYGLGFGLLAALVSIVNLLFSAYREVDILRTPIPKNSLGFQDYTGVVRGAEQFGFFMALPTAGIILLCASVAAFLAAQCTRQSSSGLSASLVVFLFSFLLYAVASVLVAQYILKPADPFGDLPFVESTLIAHAVCGTTIFFFTIGCAEWAVSWAIPDRR